MSESASAESGLPRLTEVHITGLFGRYPVDLDFAASDKMADSRLRIVFDDNGRGKTTVLKAIHHLLSWSDLDLHLNALAELPVDTVQLNLEGSQVGFERSAEDPRACVVTVRSGEGEAALAYEVGRDDPRGRARLVLNQKSANAYRRLMASTCLPPIFVSDDRMIHGDEVFSRKYVRSQRLSGGALTYAQQQELLQRGLHREPAEELRDLLENLAQSFLQQAFGARTSTESDAVYAQVVQRIATEELKKTTDLGTLTLRASRLEARLRLAASYGLISVAQLRQVRQTLNGLRKNSKNRTTIATVLDPFFSTLEADAERLEPIANQVHLFISTTNSYLKDKKVSFEPGRGIRIQPSPKDEPLETNQLSSGERHLLLLFGAALIAGGRRLILIDEPELSLGITWKRMLLQSLLDLTEHAQAQFIVASHSVEIISPFRENALELRRQSQGPWIHRR